MLKNILHKLYKIYNCNYTALLLQCKPSFHFSFTTVKWLCTVKLMIVSIAGPMAWVQEQMLSGKDPRVILRKIIPDPDIIPDHLEDFILWKIVASIVSEPPRRKKLKHINTVDDVVTLLKTSKKIMVLTGAGVSSLLALCKLNQVRQIQARQLM